MPQSLASIILHVVFSTKERTPFIQPDVEDELHRYLGSVCRACDSPAYCIGGTQDHVHLACSLARTTSVADLLEEIKKRSSKWIKTKGSPYKGFAWQRGYGAFSLGQSQLAALKRYIAAQKKHHMKTPFKQEFLGLLKKYDVAYDERYVWD